MNNKTNLNIGTNLSIMRTYMSADRTMFAGMSTALSILAFVLVLLKMYHPNEDVIKIYRLPLILLVIINLSILGYIIYHYHRTIKLIQKKEKYLMKQKQNKYVNMN